MNSDQQPFPLELFKEIHEQSCKLKLPDDFSRFAILLSSQVGDIARNCYLQGTLHLNQERVDYLRSLVKHDSMVLCAMAVNLYRLSTTQQHESSSDRQQSR